MSTIVNISANHRNASFIRPGVMKNLKAYNLNLKPYKLRYFSKEK